MTAPLRALLVDDEPLAREGMRLHLQRLGGVEVVGECGSGDEAVALVDSLAPDILFLDVQMPGMDGFTLLEALGADAVRAVIFVTAHDEFAVRAFDANAVDYLLKPVQPERLQRAIERARAHVDVSESEGQEELRRLLAAVRPRSPERLAVRTGGRIAFIRTADIDWIGAEGNYARLVVGKASYLMRETMNALENRLDPQQFVRIHRSTIVNIDRVTALEPLFQGDYQVILSDGTKLPSSRAYRERLRRFIDG